MMQLKTILKYLVNILIVPYLRRVNRYPRVLFWHGVTDKPFSITERESIPFSDFVKQIEYLEKYYEIVSMDTYYDRLVNNTFTNAEVVLTFDDGYRNNLTVLAPYLHSKGIPFTVFVSTDNISTGELFPTSILRLIVCGSGVNTINLPCINKIFDISSEGKRDTVYNELSKIVKSSTVDMVKTICSELIDNVSNDKWLLLKREHSSVVPMGWSEVAELNDSGATIGSHCKCHICCHENQSEDIVFSEISESKKIIEAKLGVNCNYFAYPNGDHTEFSDLVVKQADYKIGFGVRNYDGYNQGKLNFSSLPRISVPYNYLSFKYLISLKQK